MACLIIIELGSLVSEQGDYRQAEALFTEALALSQERGPEWAIAGGSRGAIAASQAGLGDVARRQGDYEAARSLCEQSLTVFREVGAQAGHRSVSGHAGICGPRPG